MYNMGFKVGKEIESVSTRTELYRPASCRGDLQECSVGGDKEQTVPKVVVKLAVATTSSFNYIIISKEYLFIYFSSITKLTWPIHLINNLHRSNYCSYI